MPDPFTCWKYYLSNFNAISENGSLWMHQSYSIFKGKAAWDAFVPFGSKIWRECFIFFISWDAGYSKCKSFQQIKNNVYLEIPIFHPSQIGMMKHLTVLSLNNMLRSQNEELEVYKSQRYGIATNLSWVTQNGGRVVRIIWGYAGLSVMMSFKCMFI